MTFSSTVAQQREKQARALRQFVMASLAGSFALHGIGLLLKTSNLWTPEEPASEEIVIVVTEDESAIAPDEPESQPLPASEFVSPPDESVSTLTNEFTAVEPVADPAAETTEPIVQEEPESFAEESSEAIAPPQPETRNLSSLLADLRQAQQQAVSTGSREPLGATEAPAIRRGEPSGTTTAAAPTRPSVAVTPSASPSPAEQTRRSREITCRSCDFDYPDNADGAEGTAQVIVETNDRGEVVSVILSRSSGNAVLDRAALEQARRRVRLNNARAGESYPIDIDFVQPGSEAAQRVRERGDRRSITVSDPESETVEAPDAQPKAPESASSNSQDEPAAVPQPSASPDIETLTPGIPDALDAPIPPESSQPEPAASTPPPGAASPAPEPAPLPAAETPHRVDSPPASVPAPPPEQPASPIAPVEAPSPAEVP